MSITPEQVHAKVKEFAARYPNGVYIPVGPAPPRCHYDKGVVIDGPETEGCIFGQVQRELTGEVEKKSEPIRKLYQSMFGHSCSSYKLEWFKEVQRAQDVNMSWSKCVESADKYYPYAFPPRVSAT